MAGKFQGACQKEGLSCPGSLAALSLRTRKAQKMPQGLPHPERKPPTVDPILKLGSQSSLLVRKELKTKLSVKCHIKRADRAR